MPPLSVVELEKVKVDQQQNDILVSNKPDDEDAQTQRIKGNVAIIVILEVRVFVKLTQC